MRRQPFVNGPVQKQQGSRKTRLILAASAAVVVTALFLAYFALKPVPAIPANINKEVSFAIFYPADKSILKADSNSFSYNKQTQVLSFKAYTPSHKELVFSEQATPEGFVDVPQSYDKLVSDLQNYSNFNSINGQVSLTKPKNLFGQQVAVMNAKGTLLFLRSQAAFTDNDWRRIFNNLQVAK